jgi:hypothetical protein
MSGVLDLLSAQNLTRAQATTGAVQTAQRTFGSSAANVSTAGRAAIAGSLFTTLGGVLTGFNRTPKAPSGGFNITNFQSKINKMGGFGSVSKFIVAITPPNCVNPGVAPGNIIRQEFNNSGQITGETTIRPRPGDPAGQVEQRIFNDAAGKDLIFLCAKAAIPGLDFSTTSIQKLGYGTRDMLPVSRQPKTINLSFYVDVSGAFYGFFTKWMSNIINWNNQAVGSLTSDGAFFNEVHYKRNYISPAIDIYVYDAAGNTFIQVTLIEAFPIGLGEVDLMWTQQNDIAIVNVKMAYKTWKSNYMSPTNIASNSLRNLSLASTLMRVGSAVQAGSGLLRRPTSTMDAFNLVRNGSRVLSSLSI